MIKSNELRLGVLAIESNITHKGITEKIIPVSIKDIMNHQNLTPIPLTEEWLLKFGFDKTNRIDFGELKPCYAIFSFALMIRRNSYFIDWIGGNTEIKHVHQLQNLYFALTGQELELK